MPSVGDGTARVCQTGLNAAAGWGAAMHILKRIVFVLCFHIRSACALPTISCHSAVLSPSALLVLRSELDGRLEPKQGSTRAEIYGFLRTLHNIVVHAFGPGV